MAAAQAGYSGAPLPKKLGLKEGQRAAFLNLPATLSGLRTAAKFESVADSLSGLSGVDVVHIFTDARAELSETLKQARSAIKPNGMVWASWPKKASKVATDITEDVVRAEAFPLDFVDVKVCAVDEVWSGLKLMIRREKRGLS